MHTIRTYDDLTDRHGVARLWQTVFGYEAAHTDPSLVIAKKLAIKDNLFFVASEESNIIGTAMAGYDGHRGWLYAVAVDSTQRRFGLGSGLVRTVEQALLSLGCMKINLQLMASNESIAAFYQSLGYAIEPRISMGKILHGNISRAGAA